MGRSHFELFYDLLFEERDSSELSSEYCMTNEIYGPCIYSHNLIWSYCCCQLFSGIATTTLLLKRGETSCCVKLFVVSSKVLEHGKVDGDEKLFTTHSNVSAP